MGLVLTNNLDEFGQWRPACNRFGKEYLEAYHKHVEKSAPEEDYDGRLDLYKLYVLQCGFGPPHLTYTNLSQKIQYPCLRIVSREYTASRTVSETPYVGMC